MHKKIILNGRFLTRPITGVQRYAYELFAQFNRLLSEPEYRDLELTCLVPPETATLPAWERLSLQRAGRNHGNLWEQIDLPWLAGGDLLFSPANTGPFSYANQALTWHDAAVFAVPEAYSRAFRAKYWVIFKSLARRARLLLTDSRFSQRELARYLGLPLEKFQVILLGGDHLAQVESDPTILTRLGLTHGNYFLTVASQSRHKNFAAVIQAARSLPESEFLAVGGSFSQVFQADEPLQLPPNLRLPGYLTDAEIKALYEHALAYLFPSFYEGFGLPVLEALNSDCPVICSSAASLPEVAGDAALYFDPRDATSLVTVLQRFLTDPTLRLQLQSRGRQQAEGFSWEKTARQTLDALRSTFA
jgi:glycosyltransferase involved in cell wall biosynthesis